jgi:hypothetical protein
MEQDTIDISDGSDLSAVNLIHCIDKLDKQEINKIFGNQRSYRKKNFSPEKSMTRQDVFEVE